MLRNLGIILDAIGTGDEVTETMAEGRCKMEEGTFVILSAEEEDDDLGGEDALAGIRAEVL